MILTQLSLPAPKSHSVQYFVPYRKEQAGLVSGTWTIAGDPDYRAQSGGKRVQEEERTSQNLAFIDGLQDHNTAFVEQYRKLH